MSILVDFKTLAFLKSTKILWLGLWPILRVTHGQPTNFDYSIQFLAITVISFTNLLK